MITDLLTLDLIYTKPALCHSKQFKATAIAWRMIVITF